LNRHGFVAGRCQIVLQAITVSHEVSSRRPKAKQYSPDRSFCQGEAAVIPVDLSSLSFHWRARTSRLTRKARTYITKPNG
jgi:hypothetical protein